MAQSIIPRFKLIMRYDVNQATHEQYYQFVINELVPAFQGLGLYMLQVYHTAYGKYPVRQLEFVAEDMNTIREAMKSDTWNRLQEEFKGYTSNYSQKIVHFRDDFQF